MVIRALPETGIEYYRRLSETFFKEEHGEFMESLKSLAQALDALELAPAPAAQSQS